MLDFFNIESLLSEEERAVRDSVRRFVDEKVLPIWQERDPVKLAIKMVTDAGLLTSKDIEALEAELKQELAAAFNEAEKAPLPTPDMAGKYVYAA